MYSIKSFVCFVKIKLCFYIAVLLISNMLHKNGSCSLFFPSLTFKNSIIQWQHILFNTQVNNQKSVIKANMSNDLISKFAFNKKCPLQFTSMGNIDREVGELRGLFSLSNWKSLLSEYCRFRILCTAIPCTKNVLSGCPSQELYHVHSFPTFWTWCYQQWKLMLTNSSPR